MSMIPNIKHIYILYINLHSTTDTIIIHTIIHNTIMNLYLFILNECLSYMNTFKNNTISLTCNHMVSPYAKVILMILIFYISP
ncbi:hypothetical protein GDO81_021006 [Engystomops pustulosus]|uniref:Uncharacterized protein n=1 Tax=Engystomops pustulosus TaxID=76066 RepID=A0AAV6YW11_ENGPU|nr:hypothetical protein GDO81_021006 [Engystomops pustulosus]